MMLELTSTTGTKHLVNMDRVLVASPNNPRSPDEGTVLAFTWGHSEDESYIIVQETLAEVYKLWFKVSRSSRT